MSLRCPDWPRMMRRATAARYCDLTKPDFDRQVERGRLPAPITLGDEDHWCRHQLDEFLDRLLGNIPEYDWRKDQLGLNP